MSQLRPRRRFVSMFGPESSQTGESNLEKFAFILHPLEVADFTRKLKWLQFIPESWIERAAAKLSPFRVAHVDGIRSKTGAEAEGWFIAVPMTPRMLESSNAAYVQSRIEQAGRMAEDLGAQIVGLGAHLKIVGDHGATLSKRLRIPVTTGNSFTAASALKAALWAAGRVGIDASVSRVAIVGATGNIGRACAELLAPIFPKLTLIGRSEPKLVELASTLSARYPLELSVGTDARRTVADADVIFTISSSIDVLMDAESVKPGAVVCDVSRPRNVSADLHKKRRDVLVIDGGVIRVPGEKVDLGFSLGFPHGTVEACIAETMILALERRHECYTIGDLIYRDKIEEISLLALKHGFTVTGLRRFERVVPDEEIEAVRRVVGRPPVLRPSAPATAALSNQSPFWL